MPSSIYFYESQVILRQYNPEIQHRQYQTQSLDTIQSQLYSPQTGTACLSSFISF